MRRGPRNRQPQSVNSSPASLAGSRGLGAAAPAAGKTQPRDDVAKAPKVLRDSRGAERRGAQQQRGTETNGRNGKQGPDGTQEPPRDRADGREKESHEGEGADGSGKGKPDATVPGQQGKDQPAGHDDPLNLHSKPDNIQGMKGSLKSGLRQRDRRDSINEEDSEDDTSMDLGGSPPSKKHVHHLHPQCMRQPGGSPNTQR